MKPATKRIRAARLGAACVILLGAAAVSMQGCTNEPPTDPTTRAMSDPMHYSPHFQEHPVTGGNKDFNSREFNRDMDHVLNP